MAETLISPGVIARENDQSFVTSQPIERGAAIIGPTVIGPVERPTLISSFSSYQALFGGALLSGSNEYTYLTSIAANQYFQNGGTSLLVTRVTSGSFSSATSTTIQNNLESPTGGLIGNIFSGYKTSTGGGSGSSAPGTYTNVPLVTDTGAGSGAEVTVTTSNSNGILFTGTPFTSIIVQSGSNMVAGPYTDVSGTGGDGTGALWDITVSTGDTFLPGAEVTAGGTTITGVTPSTTTTNINVSDLISNGGSVSGGGSGGVVTVTSDGAGEITKITLVSGGSSYTNTSVINVTAAGINALAGAPLGSGAAGGAATFSIQNADLAGTINAGDITLDAGNTTLGSGYKVGDQISIPATSLGASSGDALIFQITQPQILTEISGVSITEDGLGYADGDEVSIASGTAGVFSTDPVFVLTDAMIENQTAFVLETISEGEIINNTYPAGSDTSGLEIAGGALTSGSSLNVRWEITSVNTSSGVFSLAIRRGNDNTNNKVVLETYNNISLDPFSPNYISRAIGDISTNLVTEGVDTFLQESGSFAQISNYVRVRQVNTPTPNYFNNDGTAKSEFTASLPIIGSGSFDGAVGRNIPVARAANFYQDINNIDTQGLIGSDYNNAIALLASQDDYQYNVISVPGLTNQDHAGQITTVMNNSITRGDNIAVIDLVRYNQPIATVTNQAGGIDNSYTATYWPWLQTVDPNSGQLVYIPASTFIPGVYAFTDASSDPWFAPAGITRGGMGQVVRAERKLTSNNRDTLYEANVNPIATFPQQGVVVFGQKTLQKAASALDRVNVRRLLITLKEYISQIADNLVFEANTIATRQNFLTQVNPYLESVQQRQGLYAFKVVMDETNNTPDVIDRNELVGQIFLQPTRTAEFIMLDFNVLPTGATFPA